LEAGEICCLHQLLFDGGSQVRSRLLPTERMAQLLHRDRILLEPALRVHLQEVFCLNHGAVEEQVIGLEVISPEAN